MFELGVIQPKPENKICAIIKIIICMIIAKISVTSPIVVNMPTRELMAGETKKSFV